MTSTAPAAVVDATASILADLSPERRELFELRLHRWWDDLLDCLLYTSRCV